MDATQPGSERECQCSFHRNLILGDSQRRSQAVSGGDRFLLGDRTLLSDPPLSSMPLSAR